MRGVSFCWSATAGFDRVLPMKVARLLQGLAVFCFLVFWTESLRSERVSRSLAGLLVRLARQGFFTK